MFSGKEAVILRLVTCPYLIRRQPSIMYLGKIKLCIVYVGTVTVCLTLIFLARSFVQTHSLTIQNLRTVTAALNGSNTEVLISISLASTLSNYTLDGLHLDDRHDMAIIIGLFVCLGLCSSYFFRLPVQ